MGCERPRIGAGQRHGTFRFANSVQGAGAVSSEPAPKKKRKAPASRGVTRGLKNALRSVSSRNRRAPAQGGKRETYNRLQIRLLPFAKSSTPVLPVSFRPRVRARGAARLLPSLTARYDPASP